MPIDPTRPDPGGHTPTSADALRLPPAGPLVVVDDNDGDIVLARICLRRSRLDRELLAFTNGAAFLHHLEAVKRGLSALPALVLLDVKMPGLGGLDVLEATRQDPAFSELPIFCMLTSSTDPRDRARAEALGASGFLTKTSDLASYVGFFDGLADEEPPAG